MPVIDEKGMEGIIRKAKAFALRYIATTHHGTRAHQLHELVPLAPRIQLDLES